MNNIDDFYAWTKKHKTEDIECFMPKCSFAILPEFYQGNSVPSIYIKEASEQHDRGWHLVAANEHLALHVFTIIVLMRKEHRIDW